MKTTEKKFEELLNDPQVETFPERLRELVGEIAKEENPIEQTVEAGILIGINFFFRHYVKEKYKILMSIRENLKNKKSEVVKNEN